MKSCSYDACVFYGEIYCVGCLPSYLSPNSLGVQPIFANSEWGHYPICCECGEVHDYVVLLTKEVT